MLFIKVHVIYNIDSVNGQATIRKYYSVCELKNIHLTLGFGH